MTASDAYADRLADLAAELVVRVRDDAPDANARFIDGLTPTERRDLLIVLAAAVPDDRPWLHLTAWTTTTRRPPPQPCGTAAAAKRHRSRGEDPCEPCAEAEREDWRVRKALARARRNPAA